MLSDKWCDVVDPVTLRNMPGQHFRVSGSMTSEGQQPREIVSACRSDESATGTSFSLSGSKNYGVMHFVPGKLASCYYSKLSIRLNISEPRIFGQNCFLIDASNPTAACDDKNINCVIRCDVSTPIKP